MNLSRSGRRGVMSRHTWLGRVRLYLEQGGVDVHQPGLAERLVALHRTGLAPRKAADEFIASATKGGAR